MSLGSKYGFGYGKFVYWVVYILILNKLKIKKYGINYFKWLYIFMKLGIVWLL